MTVAAYAILQHEWFQNLKNNSEVPLLKEVLIFTLDCERLQCFQLKSREAEASRVS